MKVVLVTYYTPSSENIRGASALPYHLLIERQQDVEVQVYSYNANELSKEKITETERALRLTITQLPLPKWLKWLFRFHLLFLRVFLKYPFPNYITLTNMQVEVIKANRPDLVWIYGEELSRIAKQFPNYRRVHLGPDTESLYYYRMMGRRFVMNNALDYWKCALMYRKYARMEREFPSDNNYTYYAVGEEDVRHLQQLNPKVKAKFLRHPHYEVNSQFTIHNSHFHQPKIRLLIAGQYNLYMKQEADLLSEEFRVKSEEFATHYNITFLGKGWEKHTEALRSAGWEVNHIAFAPDYIEEICKHDIQITPIAIGTGTKGKVLDALANGLLVIGTLYAMENIAVEHGMSCVEYRSPDEVTEVLQDIVIHTSKYEAMAMAGREAVLKHHDRQLLSKELFSL
jgi:glycosyltransferase involved in cell wall biosynthesis